MPDPIKLIFIATADHGSFAKSATARALELCRQFYRNRLDSTSILPAPAVLRFIHFRNHRNDIRCFDFTLSTTARPRPPGKIAWKSLASFVAAGDPSFAPATFLDTATPLNVLNLYHSIRGAPAGSVLELSIYAHGWTEGPILRAEDENSNDNFPPPDIGGLPIRKPEDMDGRVRTDFQSNMGEDPTVGLAAGVFPRVGGVNALLEFKTAFDPEALFIIYGCNGQDAVRQGGNLLGLLQATATQVIHAAFTLPIRANEREKKKTVKSARARFGAILARGEIPTDPIELDMGAEFRGELRDINHGGHYSKWSTDPEKDKRLRLFLHYQIDPFFFPPVSITAGEVDDLSLQVLKFPKTIPEVQGVIARRMQEMYGFKAARALGIKVLAGPVGVKSSQTPDDQMQVCGVTKVSECTRALTFHETFMGIRMGERKYFIFDQDAVDHIDDLASQ